MATRTRTTKRAKAGRVARGSATASAGAARTQSAARKKSSWRTLEIPRDQENIVIRVEGKDVKLTNLNKPFWPEEGIAKGDLIQYYADVSPTLLPHLRDRAMVMKRYPNGWQGKFFFMKRAPSPRPDWIQICTIPHRQAGLVDFPMINGLPELLWVINLGCIDLNQWYARCDDWDRPDYLHFDLDPVKATSGKGEVPFERVLEVSLLVRDALSSMGIPSYCKTTGSRGTHIYVPIERGPTQKAVWTFAKAVARTMARQYPKVITAEYRVDKRPAGRVLVDYNQNAWGRTLASVYSVRPKPHATVSTPVSWEEVERGIAIEDFRLDNMPQRIAKIGDLFAPVRENKGRVKLQKYLG